MESNIFLLADRTTQSIKASVVSAYLATTANESDSGLVTRSGVFGYYGAGAGGAKGRPHLNDLDDDDIAVEQIPQLVINQNYVHSKGDQAWIRMQGSGDGYLFTRPIGIYTPGGDSVMDETLNAIKTVESPATNFEGAPVAVGTSAVEMTFVGTPKSIMLQSDPDNTGRVWFGKSNIDNTGANAMGQLEAGDAVTVDLDDASNAIYTVSDIASQNVFKLALL